MRAVKHLRGFGLIETVVGTAIFVVVFFALVGLLRISIILSVVGKANATATSIAQSQVEYLRGLAYDSVGTIAGIPPGPVPQATTSVSNGVTYTTQTFIQYVDDPADGLDVLDDTGIITDYKLAKVTVSYEAHGISKSVALVTILVPPSIESSTGGGTLQAKVVNAGGVAVAGASVHIVNQSTSPAINLTTLSNVAGLVYLPGAATSSAYEIYVTKAGYSSAQTYAQDVQNANPTPGFLTVVKDQTTTGTFAIDLLSTLTLSTFSPTATSTFSDTFTNGMNIAASTSVIVSGGEITLNPGDSSGSARAIAFAPQYLSRWGVATATLMVPLDTTAVVQVYDGAGGLLSDAVLPGNSSGFTAFPLDLSNISTSTFSSLALGALFTTATSTVSAVADWSISASAGPTPLPNVAVTFTGTKTIGSTSLGDPIYKTTISTTTDSVGVRTLTLEWDGYALVVPSYDIVDACPVAPYAIAPGASLTALFMLAAPSAYSLFVSVTDSTGVVVPGATVTVTRSGFSTEGATSACGNAYFAGLSNNSYTVDIAKSGYTTTQFAGVAVGGATSFTASFP